MTEIYSNQTNQCRSSRRGLRLLSLFFAIGALLCVGGYSAIAHANPLPAAIAVSGQVLDETGKPMPGVNVLVKGTTNGTSTDTDGNYSINVENGDAVLIFSFIGYFTQEIPVGNRTVINVSLAPDIATLSEVVVVGYGTQERASVTGAISSVTAEEISQQPVVNVGQALQGRVAGVTVTNNGAPGDLR